MFIAKKIKLTNELEDSITISINTECIKLKVNKNELELTTDEVNELSDTLCDAVDYFNEIKDFDEEEVLDDEELEEDEELEKDNAPASVKSVVDDAIRSALDKINEHLMTTTDPSNKKVKVTCEIIDEDVNKE